MNSCLSDEELWSGIDRNSIDVAEHIETCPECRTRAAEFRAGIRAVAGTSAPPATALPTSIGPYAIQRRLGEGGMGIVYEGEQQSPKRLVAIKVVRRGQDASEYRTHLFLREAQTLARLRHPAIAAVYQAGRTDDGQEYFAMELVSGVPLNQFVQERSVPREQRLDLFRRICDAINYAHQRGVIHRDLKPSNILVDEEGNPKILDFGLARITDPEVAVTTLFSDVGRMMGTLPYMSPEEARGDPDEIDVRSDVYSLGIILYELLTDKLPYTVRRTALPEAIRVICEDAPQRPSSHDRSLRGDLDTITLKALEKETSRRYQSAAQVGEDVQRYLSDQPILARRATAWYHMRKFLARHRLYAIAAVASILVVSAARIWIDRLEADRRVEIERTEDLAMLRQAVLEYDLAVLLYGLERFDQAEPKYRRALGTFTSQSDDERSGPAKVELAELLIQRNGAREEPSHTDYEEAETLLDDALDILEVNPTAWSSARARDLRRRALEALRTLYGPEVWDDPEVLADIESELESLDATPQESEVPSPSQ